MSNLRKSRVRRPGLGDAPACWCFSLSEFLDGSDSYLGGGSRESVLVSSTTDLACGFLLETSSKQITPTLERNEITWSECPVDRTLEGIAIGRSQDFTTDISLTEIKNNDYRTEAAFTQPYARESDPLHPKNFPSDFFYAWSWDFKKTDNIRGKELSTPKNELSDGSIWRGGGGILWHGKTIKSWIPRHVNRKPPSFCGVRRLVAQYSF